MSTRDLLELKDESGPVDRTPLSAPASIIATDIIAVLFVFAAIILALCL